MKKFLFEILTPTGSVFSGSCGYVNLPGASGRFGVMYQHMNLVSQLYEGTVHVELDSGKSIDYNITKGVAEVTGSHCILLVEKAEQLN